MITFLLTDVEGSTWLWESDPVTMETALFEHDSLVEAAVHRNGGELIRSKGEGDSTFSIFEDPALAVAAAIDIQRDLARSQGRLSVRIGIHLGHATTRGGDWFGAVVNRAARIRGLAGGGQTVVSADIVAAVADRAPEGATFIDQGEHVLRGVLLPERVWSLAHPDLPVVESLEAPSPAPSNLPAPLDRFVGRDDELVALDKALTAHRLVTVTGPGGTGKTRLALEVAARMLSSSPGGVWLVELGTLSDDAEVPAAIAAACGVEGDEGDPLAAAALALAEPAVLVLDTCEVVVDGAAATAVALLRTCPHLRVLATSRVPLDADGEAILRLDPLGEAEAIDLFLQRAGAADLGFDPDAADLEHVAGVCRAVDGLPLAVELAAARLRTTTLDELAEGIGRRLASLTSGRRTAPARQRTLRATIEWSEDRLDPTERACFRRLAVFVGGFTEEAAAEVCAVGGIRQADALDALDELVQASMVAVDDRDGCRRYRLLDTIRELAAERLEEAGERNVLRNRHLDWAVAVAGAAEAGMQTEDRARSAGRLDTEQPNLLAALDHAATIGAGGLAQRLVVDLFERWSERPGWEAAIDRTDLAISLPGGTPATRGAALVARALWSQRTGRGDVGVALDEAIQLLQGPGGDRKVLAEARNIAGIVAHGRGDADSAVALFEAAAADYRAVGNDPGVAMSLHNLLIIERDRSGPDLDRQLEWIEEVLDIERRAGRGISPRLLDTAIQLADSAGDHAKVDALLVELERSGAPGGTHEGSLDVASLVASLQAEQLERRGRLREAQERAEEALELARSAGHAGDILSRLVHLATLRRHLGDLEGARDALDEAARRGTDADDADSVALGRASLHLANDEVTAAAVQLAAVSTATKLRAGVLAVRARLAVAGADDPDDVLAGIAAELSRQRATGRRRVETLLLHAQATVLVALGRFDEARAIARPGVERAARFGLVIEGLELLDVWCLSPDLSPDVARQLLEGADALRRSTAWLRSPSAARAIAARYRELPDGPPPPARTLDDLLALAVAT